MSTHNIGFYEEVSKIIIKHTLYHMFFCKYIKLFMRAASQLPGGEPTVVDDAPAR